MRRGVHRSLVLVAVVGGGGLASASPAQGGVAAPSGRHAASVQAGAANGARLTTRLVSYLHKHRFQVNPGYPLLYATEPLATCRNYTFPALGNCTGANALAPYVNLVVKSWPHEYVDPTVVDTFGPVRRGYSPVYRLDPREAIVLYGKMPPPGRYMGLETVEFSQRGRWTAKEYDTWAHTPNIPYPMYLLFSTLPPNDRTSRRVLSLSSLGDIVNNVVMQRRSGYPFAKNRYFIITPSATTDRAVRRALRAQGVSGGHIFTEQIPDRDRHGPIGPLGTGRNAIDFATTFRYAIPTSQEAAQQWRSQLPLTVLRVRAPSSLGPVRRYGALTYDKRRARSEAYLTGDLQNLVRAVCDRTAGALHLQSTDCSTPPPASSLMLETVGDLGWDGPHCRAMHMNCTVDQNDVAYFGSRLLPLDSGQVYAVVDTLATETGNATYVGVTPFDASTMFSPTGVFDTILKGSADAYASTADNAGKFFVHYYSRDCQTPEFAGLLGTRLTSDCTSITDQMVPPSTDTTAPGHSSVRGMFSVGIRDYVAVGTERAPDSSKLLRPRLLTFAKP